MAKKRQIKRAAKSAVKQYKKHKAVAKSGYNKAAGGNKGYATRVGSTKYIKYKGSKRKK